MSTQTQPLILKDKNGKEIPTSFRTAAGVIVTLVGYDEKNKTFVFSCEDTKDNRKKYNRSSNPLKKRNASGTNSETMRLINQEWNADRLPITITAPKNVIKNQDGSYSIDMTAKQFQSQRSLMHIDPRTPEEKKRDKDKENQGAAVNVGTPEPTPKPEYKWYKDWRWWAAIIGILALTTIGILGFRKGGWWNKRKKKSATTQKTNPSKTELDKTTPPVTNGPVTPDPITPDPITPDPITPDPVTPDPVTPDPVTPDPVTPNPVTPDPVTPNPIIPDPVTPNPGFNPSATSFITADTPIGNTSQQKQETPTISNNTSSQNSASGDTSASSSSNTLGNNAHPVPTTSTNKTPMDYASTDYVNPFER